MVGSTNRIEERTYSTVEKNTTPASPYPRADGGLASRAGGATHTLKGEQSWKSEMAAGSGEAAGATSPNPTVPTQPTTNGVIDVAKHTLTPQQLARIDADLAEAQRQNPSGYTVWDPQTKEIQIYATFSRYQAGDAPVNTVEMQ